MLPRSTGLVKGYGGRGKEVQNSGALRHELDTE